MVRIPKLSLPRGLFLPYALLLFLSISANAAIVSHSFTGVVRVTDPIFGGLNPGDTFAGTFAYENNATLNPDLNPHGSIGEYRWTNFEVEGNALSSNFSTGSGNGNETELLLFENFNNGTVVFDQLELEGNFSASTYTVSFRGPGSAFPGSETISNLDAVSGLNFAGTDNSFVFALSGTGSLNGTGFSQISELTGTLNAAPIPEPGTGVLALGVGWFFLVVSRRRSYCLG